MGASNVKKSAFLFVLIFSLQLLAAGQTVFRRENPTAVKIKEYFSELAKQENFNGNVLIALDDKIILRKTYNLPANVADLKTSLDKRLMIASVAKLFVKFAFRFGGSFFVFRTCVAG